MHSVPVDVITAIPSKSRNVITAIIINLFKEMQPFNDSILLESPKTFDRYASCVGRCSGIIGNRFVPSKSCHCSSLEDWNASRHGRLVAFKQTDRPQDQYFITLSPRYLHLPIIWRGNQGHLGKMWVKLPENLAAESVNRGLLNENVTDHRQ